MLLFHDSMDRKWQVLFSSRLLTVYQNRLCLLKQLLGKWNVAAWLFKLLYTSYKANMCVHVHALVSVHVYYNLE